MSLASRGCTSLWTSLCIRTAVHVPDGAGTCIQVQYVSSQHRLRISKGSIVQNGLFGALAAAQSNADIPGDHHGLVHEIVIQHSDLQSAMIQNPVDNASGCSPTDV